VHCALQIFLKVLFQLNHKMPVRTEVYQLAYFQWGRCSKHSAICLFKFCS